MAALQAKGYSEVKVSDDVSPEVYDSLVASTGLGSQHRLHPGLRRFEREAADR